MWGVGASPRGTYDCVTAWLTDFRKDLAQIEVPTLVIHGDSDRILPIAVTANRMPSTVIRGKACSNKRSASWSNLDSCK